MGLTGWRVRLRLCRVLLGLGVGAGVDGGKFCQLLSTWCQPLSRFGQRWSGWGCRECGRGGVVAGREAWRWYSCSGGRVSGAEGSGGVRWETVGVLESVGGRTWPLTPHLTSPLEADLRITPEFGDAGRSALSGRVVCHTAKFGVVRRSAGRGEGLNWGRGELGARLPSLFLRRNECGHAPEDLDPPPITARAAAAATTTADHSPQPRQPTSPTNTRAGRARPAAAARRARR